jgi:glycerol-3-phosphate acyltransferase PlsY
MGGIAILTWLATAALSRTSSIGGIMSMIAGPIVALIQGQHRLAIATALIAILVVARHADNIRRLIAGTEPKIGKKS